ncbi:type IX secretion system motor protein PorL/GldL [Marseilla massiliensis]|uniref:type IX secretion system motor protein PorL/GldL n=1 Tax=Marseilla massiliensis TaxID=1841864 RepID=UPI0020133EA5|nr:gliding motility protein GldL [Marseilla massiliensis]MCL1611332.1 gliding motility protein GldL [Marseilla massiliensis]
MTEYSKFNIIYRLQKWLDSVPGQTFLNYAYSWGASIVILGTLFKLTHLPGANIMLYIGMGTEVIVFFISAFDRPFDKTADGKDLPTHAFGEEEAEEGAAGAVGQPAQAAGAGPVVYGGGGTVILGSPSDAVAAASADGAAAAEGATDGAVASGAQGPQGASVAVPLGGMAFVQPQPQVTPEMEEAAKEMEEATANYIDELRNLTEMLAKVSEQSQRLTRDSEEMENLNRTLTGICKVYEMQLKGASAQIGTIDQINEQSRRMAEQIAELNAIYSRMIEAMTVNMKAAAPLKD